MLLFPQRPLWLINWRVLLRYMAEPLMKFRLLSYFGKACRSRFRDMGSDLRAVDSFRGFPSAAKSERQAVSSTDHRSIHFKRYL
jgi:hypothetical protein